MVEGTYSNNLIKCLQVFRREGYEAALERMNDLTWNESEREGIESTLSMIVNSEEMEGEEGGEVNPHLAKKFFPHCYKSILEERGVFPAQLYFLALSDETRGLIQDEIDAVDLLYLTQ